MNVKIQTEVGPIEIDFDPTKYKTKAGAAKAFHKALCKFCKEVYGQNPEIEIFIDTPEESQERGYGRNWRVCWEAGPYEWAFGTSFQVANTCAGWYTEPYYSFDVCFTE
jgi:hypothetical protein